MGRNNAGEWQKHCRGKRQAQRRASQHRICWTFQCSWAIILRELRLFRPVLFPDEKLKFLNYFPNINLMQSNKRHQLCLFRSAITSTTRTFLPFSILLLLLIRWGWFSDHLKRLIKNYIWLPPHLEQQMYVAEDPSQIRAIFHVWWRTFVRHLMRCSRMVVAS